MITMIQAMKLFTQPYIMTQGGPKNSTKTLVYYIYTQGFQKGNFGYACSIAAVFFAVSYTHLDVYKRQGGTYGKRKRNTEQNKKRPGYHEDHQCHVHDFLFKNEESQKGTGGYRAIFL